ncbi:hypothetical protein B0H16DRAFT_1893362 [Mycena metata]|uniref:Uncharacterized protein n=1 Tax=Mycena metata TaxID=1033252 RepID=A0AAD7I0E6_9AGAR|nr:hypothetical protein B0H16DRAFT_1893362 [Mycena metata]
MSPIDSFWLARRPSGFPHSSFNVVVDPDVVLIVDHVFRRLARRAAMACQHAAPFSPSQVPLSVNLSFGTCGTHRYVSCTHYTRYISSNLVPSYTVSLFHTAQPPTHPVVITIPSANARAAAALIRLILRVLDLCRHRYRPRTPLLSPPLVTTPVPTAPPSRLFDSQDFTLLFASLCWNFSGT